MRQTTVAGRPGTEAGPVFPRERAGRADEAGRAGAVRLSGGAA